MIDHSSPSNSGQAKPLITFVIIAYKQEQFIRKAVEGAFSQTYSPLEIILSDDCSPDGTFETMKDMASHYRGPHTVVLNRNQKKLGLIGHVNVVMEKAGGEIIVIAAGDDVSLPRRVETSARILESDPTLMSISMGLIKGAARQKITDWASTEKTVAVRKYSMDDFCRNTSVHINAPARTIRADVYSKFGPLNTDCQVEDQPIMFRALLLGKIGVCDADGVFYRVHGSNMSAGVVNTSFNFQKIYQNCIDDTLLASEREYIPKSKISKIIRAIKRRQKRDELWRGYKNSPTKMCFFLFKILPSHVIPLNGKLRRLKELFLG